MLNDGEGRCDVQVMKEPILTEDDGPMKVIVVDEKNQRLFVGGGSKDLRVLNLDLELVKSVEMGSVINSLLIHEDQLFCGLENKKLVVLNLSELTEVITLPTTSQVVHLRMTP